ncbi:unnamed protein product [Peniophora sp. CBMAI 1063]|nr:unnamed protein product [Peniophora sp. CBMAI 1063]
MDTPAVDGHGDLERVSHSGDGEVSSPSCSERARGFYKEDQDELDSSDYEDNAVEEESDEEGVRGEGDGIEAEEDDDEPGSQVPSSEFDGEDSEEELGLSSVIANPEDDYLLEEEIRDPSVRKVSWKSFVHHLARLGFPASFLRRGPYSPPCAEVYFRVLTSSDGKIRSRRLIVCAGYEWSLDPDPQNIAMLAKTLRYSVPSDGKTQQDQSLDDETSEESIWALFAQRCWQARRSYELVHNSPQTFLGIFKSLVEPQVRLDTMQVCDYLNALAAAVINSHYDDDEHAPRSLIKEQTYTDVYCSICWRLIDHLDKPGIVFPVLSLLEGIVNYIFDVYEGGHSQPQLSRQVKAVADKFWDRLWANRAYLLDDKILPFLLYRSPIINASALRTIVLRFYERYGPATFINTPYLIGNHGSDAYLPSCRVILLCWMHPTVGTDNSPVIHHVAFNLALTLFRDKRSRRSGLTETDFSRFVSEDIVGTYGAEAFMVRLAQSIQDDEAIEQPKETATLLITLTVLIRRPEFRPYFVSSEVYDAISSLFESAAIPSLDIDDQWTVYCGIVSTLTAMLLHGAVRQAAKPLLKHNIFGIIARASVYFLKAPSSDIEHNAIMNNMLVAYCRIAGGARARGNEHDVELLKKITRSAQPEWYPTIHALRRIPLQEPSARAKYELILEDWLQLGSVLGFKEDVERRTYEKNSKRAAQLCAWKTWCAEARYCSRECQRKDWKLGGHRQRCKRLKSEPQARR